MTLIWHIQTDIHLLTLKHTSSQEQTPIHPHANPLIFSKDCYIHYNSLRAACLPGEAACARIIKQCWSHSYFKSAACIRASRGGTNKTLRVHKKDISSIENVRFWCNLKENSTHIIKNAKLDSHWQITRGIKNSLLHWHMWVLHHSALHKSL